MSPPAKSKEAAAPKKKKKQEGPFTFVTLSHPKDSVAWKREVRSHAARNPSARRRRVAAYQAEASSGQDAEEDEEATSLQSGTLVVSRRGSPVRMQADPITLLDATNMDPFGSFCKPLTSFERLLIDHFQDANVLFNVTRIDGLEFKISPSKQQVFWRSLADHWLHASLTDIGMLASVLLFSCRHVIMEKPNEPNLAFYHHQAEFYRSVCMEQLANSLEKDQNDRVIRDDTITKTMVLASDSNLLGLKDAGLHHLKATADLIQLRDLYQDDRRPHRDSSLNRLMILFSPTGSSKDNLGGVYLGNSSQSDQTPPSTARLPRSFRSPHKELVLRIGRGDG
ncbi:hypothetical protein CPLU01_05389 [Colletotrichum plurivorum]|uniref:Uncharacterized protein n=1 Tax=Colletotrichum plurivorum TaxID=2175906 RepID=A0A8H6KLW6_9PEZI|nr:hypothetical protein CPLU01_05389 [Colletotrichum plurivorum]